MKRIPLALLLTLLAAPAFAQQPQPVDPAFLQEATKALQGQRNRALDEAAGAEALVGRLQQSMAEAQKQITDLTAKAKDADSLRQQAAADQKQIADLRQQVSDLTAKITDLTAKVKATDAPPVPAPAAH